MTPSDRHMHVAHASLISLHVLCCTVPAALALLGVASGVGLLGLHGLLHAHELMLLGFSGCVVAIGAWFERRRLAKGSARVSPLFLLSAGLFVLNGLVFASHFNHA